MLLHSVCRHNRVRDYEKKYAGLLRSELISELDKRYSRVTPSITKWRTPFGVTFAAPDFRPGYVVWEWYCFYDKRGTALLAERGDEGEGQEEEDGANVWISDYELMHLISVFDTYAASSSSSSTSATEQTHSFDLYKKSIELIHLETLFNVKAQLCPLHFLRWRLLTPQFEILCNPFNLLRCCSSAGNNFQLTIFATDANKIDNSDDDDDDDKKYNDGEKTVCFATVNTILRELAYRDIYPVNKPAISWDLT